MSEATHAQPGASGAVHAGAEIEQLGQDTSLSMTSPRLTDVGGITVSRLLPQRARRSIGPWCFIDYLAPREPIPSGLLVGPHPHIGIQTLTWLFSGEVLHHDSLDNHVLTTAGDVNVMTAGRGIAHAEESPIGSLATLHALQCWIALPASAAVIAPAFEHHVAGPPHQRGPTEMRVFAGELAWAVAPGRTYSPIVGAELRFRRVGAYDLLLNETFEHGVILISGRASIDGVALEPANLAYLDVGRSTLSIEAEEDSVLVVLGGVPFEERIVMWWNFVGATPGDIERARADWESGQRFGVVHGARSARVHAPPLPPGRLKARARVPEQ